MRMHVSCGWYSGLALSVGVKSKAITTKVLWQLKVFNFFLQKYLFKKFKKKCGYGPNGNCKLWALKKFQKDKAFTQYLRFTTRNNFPNIFYTLLWKTVILHICLAYLYILLQNYGTYQGLFKHRLKHKWGDDYNPNIIMNFCCFEMRFLKVPCWCPKT